MKCITKSKDFKVQQILLNDTLYPLSSKVPLKSIILFLIRRIRIV